jgi:hypothetical protein
LNAWLPLRAHVATCLVAFGALTPTSAADPPSASTPDKAGVEFFETHVRPLLIEHCYECHSHESGEREGGLRLDSAPGMLAGGLTGPALVVGDPGASLLIRVVEYEDADMQMPPAGKLDDEAIEKLQQWIAMGAQDPRQIDPAAGEDSEAVVSPMERDPKTHWAFVAPLQPDAPEQTGVTDRDATDHDAIDAWAATAARERGLSVNGPADDETLVRRLHFDLTGLPPSLETIRDYVASKRPDRYVRLVDSLLASPEFGERFGRHWLDVARYADTIGYATAGKERRYKGSERYRDWTIDSFNGDMPYDQMILHQLAGDRTDPNNVDGNADAMGFLTLGRKYLNGLDVTDDRIDVVTRGLLGMTVACARCHDHKFDPIPTVDYYAMFGIFQSSKSPDDGAIEAGASPLMLVDAEKPRDYRVFVRGQQGNQGDIAPRHFLTSLRKPDDPPFRDGSGRWELANRIIAEDNPLTARVMVNRLWSILIGKPLIDSTSDFGFRTTPPAVPQVLEELAVEFADHWSIKRIVRRIVLTRVYRQSSDQTDANVNADPDNAFLARANRKRRDFESLRDSFLAVADRLDRTMGGPPVEITLPTPTPRRTVYAMIDRQNLPAMFRTFDFASPDAHSPGRYYTTVPQQALFLMNSPQMISLAKSTAAAVRRHAGSHSDAELVDKMYVEVLGRYPGPDERAMATDFVSQTASPPPPITEPRSLWTYGIGMIDDEHRVTSLEPFAHFTGDRWQASSEFPVDSPAGYAFLGREDGHTPRGSDRAVVRRFTAPFDADVTVRGQVGHRDKQGDGVELSIWIGDDRKFKETQKSNNRPIGGLKGKVKKGQSIDFVVSPGGSDSFDGFFLRASVDLVGSDGNAIDSRSVKDFSGPTTAAAAEPLDRFEQLAQVLLMSNEFAFVD